MSHVHLLKPRPELSEQETDDQGTSEVTRNEDVMNGQGDVQINVNDNAAHEHDSDISHFNCFFCVKKIFFLGSRESDNEEFLLL